LSRYKINPRKKGSEGISFCFLPNCPVGQKAPDPALKNAMPGDEERVYRKFRRMPSGVPPPLMCLQIQAAMPGTKGNIAGKQHDLGLMPLVIKRVPVSIIQVKTDTSLQIG